MLCKLGFSLRSKRFPGFSARSRHLWLFGGAKIRASATLMEGMEGALFCTRPNFRAFKKRKMLQTCGKPYTTETLATQVWEWNKKFHFNRKISNIKSEQCFSDFIFVESCSNVI